MRRHKPSSIYHSSFRTHRSALRRREFAQLFLNLFARLLLLAYAFEAEGEVPARVAEAAERNLRLGLARVSARERLDGEEARFPLAQVLGGLALHAREALAGEHARGRDARGERLAVGFGE